MEGTETGRILRALAEAAANALRTNPRGVEEFARETRCRMEHHGHHPVYRALLDACRAGVPSVTRLLTSESPEGDLVRSMAPLRALVSAEKRREIIARARIRLVKGSRGLNDLT